MKPSHLLAAWAALGLALFAGAAAARSQPASYPTKPVRIVTPFAAGSGPDGVLRVVGQKLSGLWGQQVVVENRPGGNGFIAIEAAKKAPADGYTLVQMDDTHMALQPHLYSKIPYDVARDFDPVAALFRTHFFVVVRKESDWKSVGDIVATARAKPGGVTYGSWFVGSPGHLGGAMLEAETGVRMTHIPYKEASQLYGAVGNGEVAWAFGSAGSSGAMYRAGKVKYVAIAAPTRYAGFPDVPTMAEAGGPPGLEVKAWVALFAPRGTPAPVVAKVNEDLRRVLVEPEVRDRFATFGFEPYAASPAEITREMQADLKRYGDIVKRAEISTD